MSRPTGPEFDEDGTEPSRRPRARRLSWIVAVLVVGSLLALVALDAVRDRFRAERADGFSLPTATAPPDPGVDPPPVRLLPPGAEPRSPAGPQRQLGDWASSMSEELDIPGAALEAYGYAAVALAESDPECEVSWPVLAGIGAVETHHGRYAGAELDNTGRTSEPIRGVALDGTGDVRLIRDTDGGRLDGDPVYDRAVGPMQFIPTTWQRWGRDADGDGAADPDDIDDAAMSAARYLCESGGDLRDAEHFWNALLEYNASADYVQKVLDHADYYGRRSHRLSERG